jgi:ABC-type antimicrobial peptide transport system permease subunit
VKRFAISIGVLALVANLIGGVSTLFGVYLIVVKAGVQMFGWGDARTFGYLFFCVGLCCVCAGLVLAKYVRK